jgi:hypothetical protein
VVCMADGVGFWLRGFGVWGRMVVFRKWVV